MCPCLHCRWQRTDRTEDFYKWAATREYRPPLRGVISSQQEMT